MVPHRTPSLFKNLWPKLIWDMPNEEQKIYLTFDDGPIPDLTEWVLQTLEQFQVKATFFCVGENVVKHPEVFTRLTKAGHSVGNHTFHHLNGRKVSAEDFLEDIETCDQALVAHGIKTDLFRPPYGRLKTGQRKSLGNRKLIMWDVLSKDYDQSLSSEEVLKGTIEATRPGSIVVFHDNLKAESNLKSVLPGYIQHCLDQGYQFDKL